MHEATIWLTPLLLAAAVAVLTVSTRRRCRALEDALRGGDAVLQRRALLCRSAVLGLYASMVLLVGALVVGLLLRTTEHGYVSALTLCTGAGVLALLVANVQLLREALLDTAQPPNGEQ